MARRDDVINVATAILRESGPAALTSVEVAKRLGVTQPAIYRHVDSMEELTSIASHALVSELAAVLMETINDPETTWGDGGHIREFADRLTVLIVEHRQSFATIERWRYDASELGEGIREILDIGVQLAEERFEQEWRVNFSFDEPFDDKTSAAAAAHAGLLVDELVSSSRPIRLADADTLPIATHLLSMRMFTSWCSFVLDVNTRVGLPIPELDSAQMSSPRLVA